MVDLSAWVGPAVRVVGLETGTLYAENNPGAVEVGAEPVIVTERGTSFPAFMITSISASPGGTVTIEWSDIGFNYTVEETTSLLFPAWSPAVGSWPMATNAWSGGISSTNNATFYRIIGQ